MADPFPVCWATGRVQYGGPVAGDVCSILNCNKAADARLLLGSSDTPQSCLLCKDHSIGLARDLLVAATGEALC